MTKLELIQRIKDRQELAERTYNTYQQLLGQIALLKNLLEEEMKREKDDTNKGVNPEKEPVKKTTKKKK